MARGEREGSSPCSCQKMAIRWRGRRKFVGVGVPVGLGLREDVVEMRNGETRTMGRTARSWASRGDVGKWPEVHRAPARVRVDGATDLLWEKRNGRHQRVRTGEGMRMDHKMVELTHRAAAGELVTVAATVDSGEQLKQPDGVSEKVEWGETERRARGSWGGPRSGRGHSDGGGKRALTRRFPAP